MSLLESLKNLPAEKVRSDLELKQVFNYLKSIFEKEVKAPQSKEGGAL